MPDTVKKLIIATGQKVHVTMVTEGGKHLLYHTTNPASVFNIRYGEYDAVIAQDNASAFDAGKFREGAKILKDLTTKAGSRFFLYMPWAGKNNRAAQRPMTDAYHAFCRSNDCLFAPVGEVFTRILAKEPPELIYREDGNHATPVGSYIAAVTIFYTVTGRKRILDITTIDDPGVAAGIDPELCQRIHTEACRTARLFNG